MGSGTIEDITEQLIDVGDGQLHVTVTGSGPPVVWLHGGGPGASGMSNFRANLPAFGDFTNLVFDHPRFGGSSRETFDEPIIDHSAERVRRALEALGHDRVSLIGNSLGGGVAARLAALHPELVDKAVLMAPGGYLPPDLKLPDELPVGLKALFGYFMQGPDRGRMREFCELQIFDHDLLTDELVDGRFEASDRPSEMDMSAGVPDLGRVDGLWERISAPTLLIWGREDNFLPVDWSIAWVKGIRDARLIVEPRCGHWVQYEKRERFDRVVGGFLRQT